MSVVRAGASLAGASLAGARVDRAEAARRAHEILSASKYRQRRLINPVGGGGGDSWLADHVFGPLGRFFAPVLRLALSPVGLVASAVLVIVAALYLGRRRSARSAGTAPASRRTEAHADPVDLERDAARAEAAGDWARAVRLRFRVGLVQLDRAGAIQLRPHLTTNQLQRTLRSVPFDGLAGTFDAITYGDRPARADDAAHARDTWPTVVATAAAGAPARRGSAPRTGSVPAHPNGTTAPNRTGTAPDRTGTAPDRTGTAPDRAAEAQ